MFSTGVSDTAMLERTGKARSACAGRHPDDVRGQLSGGTARAWVQAMGALGAAEEVTPLGAHLTVMPVDPRVGKMLVVGALLRCAGPVLTIAAAMAHGRSIFFSPPDRRQEANVGRSPFFPLL